MTLAETPVRVAVGAWGLRVVVALGEDAARVGLGEVTGLAAVGEGELFTAAVDDEAAVVESEGVKAGSLPG